MTVTVTGLDEVNEILAKATPRIAKNLMRNTIRGIAADIRKDIMRTAPRSTGDMVKAKNIRVKMRRAIKGALLADVVFQSPSFYWRFVEHGTAGSSGAPAQPFVIPARNKAAATMNARFLSIFSRSVEKAIKSQLKKQAKTSQ